MKRKKIGTHGKVRHVTFESEDEKQFYVFKDILK